jgi:hypothetical protein
LQAAQGIEGVETEGMIRSGVEPLAK